MDKKERCRKWQILFKFFVISLVLIFIFVPILRGVTVQVIKDCLSYEAILLVLCFFWLFCVRDAKG